MKNITDFIQRVIKDLKLDKLAPAMREALELQIGKVVDRQIENALMDTLTDEDWNRFKTYQKAHPNAAPQAAFDEMLANQPKAQKAIETALLTSYEDIMIQAEAVNRAMAERDENNTGMEN